MKKLLSIVLAAIMTVSVFALSVVPAMAATTVNSPTASVQGPVTQVNGVNNTTDINYTPDSNKNNTVIFVYTGEGTLKGWENNMDALGFVEGTDYTVTNNKDGSLSITFITDSALVAFSNGSLIVNAIVDFGTGTTSVTASTKKNDSSKSPATGLSSAVVAGSVAVACAGAAVLAATKKRDAE